MMAEHPQRYALVNELHARPFAELAVPSQALFLALTAPVAGGRDHEAERAHLLNLLDRHGAAHPPPGATHHAARLGRALVKWENHTEFVTWSAFVPDAVAAGTDTAGPTHALDPVPAAFATPAVFPDDWLAAAPGARLSAVQVRVVPLPADPGAIRPALEEWFVPESLAAATILDGAAVVAGDFRLDATGQMRFAVLVRPGTGGRRVGRIVQQLAEIEIYRAMAMLGLGQARDLGARLTALEARLTALVGAMGAGDSPAEAGLHDLLRIAAELETLAVGFSFRAGATAAYEAIVNDRIATLQEVRFEGRQTLAEFMRRRFDPAMRTVKSTEARLHQIVERTARAAELLRTRVDVERSAQNQQVLARMDQRADLQLRLQATVEGLSVMAISYYAVNLASYLIMPLAGHFGWSAGAVTAALVVPMVAAVWLAVRRIRQRLH